MIHNSLAAVLVATLALAPAVPSETEFEAVDTAAVEISPVDESAAPADSETEAESRAAASAPMATPLAVGAPSAFSASGVAVSDATLGYLFPGISSTPRAVDFGAFTQGIDNWAEWNLEFKPGGPRGYFSGALPQLTMTSVSPNLATAFEWRLAHSVTGETTEWATLTAAASEPLFEGAPLYWTAPVADYALADGPAGLGAETFGRTAVAPFIAKGLERTSAGWMASATPVLDRAGIYTWDLGTGTTVGYGANGGKPVATAAYRFLGAESEVGINLAEMFPELGLTGFYVPGANIATGELLSSDLGCNNVSNMFSCANAFATEGTTFVARGTGDGVVFDLSAVPWATIGSYAHFGVDVVGFSNGVQVPLRANLTFALYGGKPGATSLSYSIPVGQTLSIPTSALEASISWNTGEEKSISVEALPASVIPVAGGFEYTALAPAVEFFGFRGTERQRPAGFVDSQSGTVTIVAFAGDDEQPAAAPTLADFRFAAPLPKGNAEDSTGGSRIPIETLTEGIDWAAAGWNDWYLESTLPADYAWNSWLPDGVELFPEEDGIALDFRIRLVNSADPSITSNWANISAPAATDGSELPVVEPEPEAPAAGAPQREIPRRVDTGDAGSPFLPLSLLVLALGAAAGALRPFGRPQ